MSEQCFYMNRSYKAPTTFINTAASVEANQNIAYTRQFAWRAIATVAGLRLHEREIPGRANWEVHRAAPDHQHDQQPPARTGAEPASLRAGCATATRAYKTNKDQWDCTNPNPAYHWSNDAERYCWVDFQRIIKAIQNNPNVVVTDPGGRGQQTWGMRSADEIAARA